MFETFEFQYLNKLVESKVRDFPSPEAFHTRKVQRLGGDKVKPSAQIRGEFPMPISALVSNFTVKSCEGTDGTPPVARTFDFARKAFVKFAELGQGLLQGFWVLNLLTRVQDQIGVDTEVCAYTFTRSGEDFFRSVIGDDIQPVRANTVAKDLDITDVSCPIAMLVKRKPTFIKLQTSQGFVPRLERQTDTTIFKFVARLELRRAVFVPFLVFRTTHTRNIEKTLPSDMQADNHSIKGVAWYPSPVFLSALEQLRQMRLQAIASRILTIASVIPILKPQKMVMYIRKVIKHVAQALVLGMAAYLIFVRSQRFYQLPVFNPLRVGRQTRSLATTLVMSANW